MVRFFSGVVVRTALLGDLILAGAYWALWHEPFGLHPMERRYCLIFSLGGEGVTYSSTVKCMKKEPATGDPERAADPSAFQSSDIGGFIREQRTLAELSLRRLADLAGVSNPYLSQIERGLRKPSAEILQQLGKALQVSAETMYVQAGMLDGGQGPESSGLEAAIRRSRELTGEQRKALLGVYRSFVVANDAVAIDAVANVRDDASDASDGDGDGTDASRSKVNVEKERDAK